MSDWWEAAPRASDYAGSGTPQPTAAPAASPSSAPAGGNWWDAAPTAEQISGGAEFRAGSGYETRPGIGPGGVIERPEYFASNLAVARASLAPNVQDQIKRYAEHFNVPTGNFGVVNGQLVRYVPEANAYAAVVPTFRAAHGPGEYLRAALGQSAASFGPTLPQAAGMTVGTIMGPTGASIPMAAIAAGLTDWARQAVDKVLAGEDAIPFAGADYDYLNMGGHAFQAGTSQAIAVGVNRLLTGAGPEGLSSADKARLASEVEKQKWAALDAEAEAGGI